MAVCGNKFFLFLQLISLAMIAAFCLVRPASAATASEPIDGPKRTNSVETTGYVAPTDRHNANELFPPNSTLVLVSGLAGDIESEKSYRDQLEGWLSFAADKVAASNTFILCDNPDTLNQSKFPQAKSFKADRQSFSNLARTLAGTTNTLICIVWGHGGRQGATPVFHVRGPRLTPQDFVDLAVGIRAPFSRWLLMFRGSGAFAARLAGDHREILSSECESSFTSDPIGAPLLLKMAHDSAVSFNELAENFGTALAAWYEERHLARTEEPTLWVGAEKPRRLVAPDSAETLLASSQTPRAESNRKEEPAKQDSTKAAARSDELPAIWKTITKVDGHNWPEADAVILQQHLDCTFGSNPAVITEEEQFIQVLTPEGKQFGDFDVSYSPPGEELDFLDCEVLQSDGSLLRLEPDKIAEGAERSVADYQTVHRKFFSLPGITPGAVLHVRYRKQWRDFPLPKIWIELPILHELPALDSTVRVSLPKQTPFHFSFEGLLPPDPATKQSDYSTTLSWHFTHLHAKSREPLSSPRSEAHLLLSTFSDWGSFKEWYGRLCKLADEVTPEIAAKAKELVGKSETEREKIRTIYNYVSGLRYVAVPLGVNSLRPHAAANVLQNQFGDCKDKANLFNTLLRSLNIDAYLVLVPRFGQAYESVPGLSFNHAISEVNLAGQSLWVDTTDEVCRFGFLPPGDPGRNVLVLDSTTSSLQELPAPQPQENKLQLHGALTCNTSGGLAANLKAKAFGFPDYEMRLAAREAKEHRATLPLLSAKFRPVAGSFALENQSATAISSLSEDFSWEATGSVVGVYSRTGSNCLLHSPFWLPREWELALGKRHNPLFLNEGFPLVLEEEFEFTLPCKTDSLGLPEMRKNDQEPLRWRIEWARIGDDTLAARLYAQLARGELSETETSAFQQQLGSLLDTLGADARCALTSTFNASAK